MSAQNMSAPISSQGFDASNPSQDVTQLRGLLARVILAVVGGALATSAFGIWLVPSAHGESGLMLMKLGVSLFMLLVGLCLLVISKES
ncbi:MAG: hypothetical protein N4A70_16645 [Pelagimonas sp.]|jgi:hypothetical protein|nr:hypothetical protein [Pelagimonas sp.]